MVFSNSLAVQNRFLGVIPSEKTYEYVYNRPYRDFRFFHLQNRPKLAIWAKNGEFVQKRKMALKNVFLGFMG